MAVGQARARLRTAARSAVLCGIAAVTTAGTVTGCASPAARPAGPAVVAAKHPAGSPVVIDCNRAQVRPSEFVLACADHGDFLSRLQWVSWASAAFGTGTEWIHDCLPSCVSNRTFHTFPVLVVLWRPEPWPGHRGRSYFTRLTEIYTGQRPRYQIPHGPRFPQAVTWPPGPWPPP